MRGGAWVLLASLALACDVRAGDAAREEEESVASAGAPGPPAGATPPIPEAPVAGTIRDRAFAYEDASIENGILTLRQGEAFFADLQVQLFLFLKDKDVVPENRVWEVDCSERWRGGTPHVHIAYTVSDQRVPEHESITCGYTLQLELGEETTSSLLPGKIALRAPELGLAVAGRFEAEIEGFRVKDGAVDLGKDDLDVAHHVAELWLASESGGDVEVVDKGLGWLHTEKPGGRPQAGYSVYWWRPASGGDLRVTKLQFEKRDGEWGVARSLDLWQVRHAHPISPRSDLMASLDRRAAEKFELEHRTAHGETPVFVWEVRSSYNPKAGLAETAIRYVRDSDDARELGRFSRDDDRFSVVRYLFRTDADYPRYNEPDAWRLDRGLAPDERVDFKTARILRD